MYTLGMCAIGIIIFGICSACTTLVVLYIIKAAKTRDVVMMGIEVISLMICSAIWCFHKDHGLLGGQLYTRLNHSY